MQNLVKKLFQATSKKLSPTERSNFAKEFVQEGETETEQGDLDLSSECEDPYAAK